VIVTGLKVSLFALGRERSPIDPTVKIHVSSVACFVALSKGKRKRTHCLESGAAIQAAAASFAQRIDMERLENSCTWRYTLLNLSFA
jgi:hypothetical protein